MNRPELSSDAFHRMHMGVGVIFLCCVALVVYSMLFLQAPMFFWSASLTLSVLATFVSYALMTLAMTFSNHKRHQEIVQTQAGAAELKSSQGCA